MNRAMTGVYGELYAGRYLRDNGYSIVTANYHCRFGEIDIIASDKNYIAFVEVKTRDVGFVVSGKEAVDYGKRKRILATSNSSFPRTALICNRDLTLPRYIWKTARFPRSII